MSAPSAVCKSEMLSCELRAAALRPRTCEFIFSAIVKPAASSAAPLIRRPEDSRWSDFERAVSFMVSWRWAFMAPTLVLMRSPMVIPP
ncbi:hypothetical protein D3C72_327720 [compost metagenome]